MLSNFFLIFGLAVMSMALLGVLLVLVMTAIDLWRMR
jgi:hypothetical protein